MATRVAIAAGFLVLGSLALLVVQVTWFDDLDDNNDVRGFGETATFTSARLEHADASCRRSTSPPGRRRSRTPAGCWPRDAPPQRDHMEVEDLEQALRMVPGLVTPVAGT